MDKYNLKKKVVENIENADNDDLLRLLKRGQGLFLRKSDVRAYQKIDPNNARLRYLQKETIDKEMWQLLWMPPTLPYYKLGGVFAKINPQEITKKLVFSSWNVVPKTVSALLSYAAEQKIATKHNRENRNTLKERKRRSQLLNFRKKHGALSGMPVVGLIYPSRTLATVGDPLSIARELQKSGSDTPTLKKVLGIARSRLNKSVNQLTQDAPKGGKYDTSWYCAAPILLDLKTNKSDLNKWFEQDKLSSVWSGTKAENGKDKSSAWADHVEEARRIAKEKGKGLGRPPKDLLDTLAIMAVAAPAVCALRALERVVPKSTELISIRNAAASVGWSFHSLFNQPESVSLLSSRKSKGPYWKRVLEYSADGGIQAMLDEYAHILVDGVGFAGRDSPKVVEAIAGKICSSLTLITSSMDVDELKTTRNSEPARFESHRMRGHFALRFGTQKAEDGGKDVREDQVRWAFNSPFWPFVLVSTSVGQEGLDFHPYCHAVVHWNLPSNPVDLEQREGRVHRFKGHAVRKNLVEKYGDMLGKTRSRDPWAELFALATRENHSDRKGLIPHWIFPGASKIERHVPALPLSKEVKKLEGLRQSLGLYRMVFGQPRQEDLLAYLKRIAPDQIDQLKEALRIDLSPPKTYR